MSKCKICHEGDMHFVDKKIINHTCPNRRCDTYIFMCDKCGKTVEFGE